MIRRPYYYTASDGDHFPDAYVGDSLFYTIDFKCWLRNENDLLTSVEWLAEEGVIASEAYVEGNYAHVKLTSTKVGSFKIECHLTSIEGEREQTKVVPMVLRVF